MDTSQMRVGETIVRVDKASKAGTRRVADKYRDRLKDNYKKEIHRTAYGSKAVHSKDSPKSMANFLVTSERTGMDAYVIGPQLGGMYTSADEDGNPSNYRTYEEIFQFQIKGFSGKKRFRLRQDRQGASDDGGFWTVTNVAPKKFADTTFNEYRRGLLERDTRLLVTPILEEELKK